MEALTDVQIFLIVPAIFGFIVAVTYIICN